MAIINFTDLDFDQIRISIKDYLRSNSNFTDYDFEGSNLSILIDILAYNTYISSYNANMVSNEVFIDSATLRENVVSLARNIGYVPRSRVAARANISFFVDVSTISGDIPRIITLKKGIVCTTTNNFGGESYTFSILEDITVPVVNGIAEFKNIEIYEGLYLTTEFTVTNAPLPQRYILENANIDTSLIRVSVKKDVLSNVRTQYNLANDILKVDSSSKVFFIQEIQDEKYELIFGDGIFGKKLETGNNIIIDYIISGGESGNGLSQFNFAGRLQPNVGPLINRGISLISTDKTSYGGSEIESVQSIRNYAPKIYSSQNRAVTAGDFKAIIPKIYPELESVSVFGGEDLIPPRYGKVFIAVKPQNGAFLPSSAAQNLKNKLRQYTVAGIVTEVIDLKYLYIELDSSIYYNTNIVSNSEIINNKIISNLTKYSKSIEINKYGSRFKYSKVLKLIDDSDEAITSNITKVSLRRDFRASLNQFAEYEICFGNEFYINNVNGYNIKSSGFKINGINEVVYFSDKPNADMKKGRIFLFKISPESKEPIEVRQSIGTIDYIKGEILLNPIKIISTVIDKGESIVEVSAIPKSNDVIGLHDLYLQLDTNKIKTIMIPDNISSGADISGSNYITTSSYTNGSLIRE